MQYIRIKNWEDFQHYKDRSPKWIKLYRDLLDNYEFTKLTDDGRGHLICIWLLASVMENKIPADAEWIRKRIGATNDIDLETMKALGFIELYDSDTEVVQNDTQMWCKTVPREEKRREEERREEKEKNKKAFKKPTPEEVEEYSKSISFKLNGQQFVDHYEAKGWMIGKNKMKDWKAAVRGWKHRQKDDNKKAEVESKWIS